VSEAEEPTRDHDVPSQASASEQETSGSGGGPSNAAEETDSGAVGEPTTEELEEAASEALVEEALEEGIAEYEDAAAEANAEEELEEARAEAIVEEALEEAITEVVAEEAIAEVVAEEAIAEVVAEEAIAEVVAEEAIAEVVAEEVLEEALAKPAAPAAVEEYIDEEPAQRVKPAIPGADLIPDIVTEGDQFLSAEAQAAAEAEAEEAALRAAEQESNIESQPITNVAIDLAAGARYTATGKRKTAVARVILKPGSGTYVVNGKTLVEFFPRETLQRIIRQPLEAVAYESRMDVIARMHGGGVSAQAGALRHGISRALIVADPHLRGELKRRGFLTRDPRVKERKKAGLKKARKRPQFSKR
jgi:small subunit ribosomal protein S9